MAARNPTEFTTWFNEEAMLPRDPIVETVPDQILSGMEEILDNRQLVAGGMFWPIRTDQTGVWAAGMEVDRYYLEAPDLCGVDDAAGAVTFNVSARVWVDVGVTGEIRVQTLVGAGSVAHVFNNVAPAWIPLLALTAVGDGADETIQVDLRTNAGQDYAWIDGIFIYMLHQ
jgi:hypothetical protein